MNVGISVFARHGISIWSSGINQNLAFLVLLLRSCEGVDGIFLINGGDGCELPAGMDAILDGVPLVRPEEVTHRVDVVIEMGAQLPLEWMRRVRALGCKLVLFVVGHTFASLAENPMFAREGGLTFSGCPWHEVWLLPHHARTSASALSTIARVPTFEMPHLWSPAYLEASIRTLGPEQRFGFDPHRSREAGWRAGIFEPNISVVKNCTVAMLACEHAYRVDRNAIETMRVVNSAHMKDHPSFNTLAAALDLTRDRRASFEPRIQFADCMCRFDLDAVVSHQWECGLNYLYYDALHGGYPLVHNSEYLRDARVGLYYPGFEAAAAGRLLVEAGKHEPGWWKDYKAAGAAFLRKLDPRHPENISAFARRLFA